VSQLVPVVSRYSFVYQKVQSSTGSMLMELALPQSFPDPVCAPVPEKIVNSGSSVPSASVDRRPVARIEGYMLELETL
jgi:hypothetical protein